MPALRGARPPPAASDVPGAGTSTAPGVLPPGPGKSPPSRGCRAGGRCSPPLLGGESQGPEGVGGKRGAPQGSPRAAGRCRVGAGEPAAPSPLPAAPAPGPALPSNAGRGRRCQTPPGGWGSSQPRPLPGEPARPHRAPAGRGSTGRGGPGEEGGLRCKAHLQLPAARERPLSPCPAEELLGLSRLFVRGDLSPLPRARTVTFLARISCQKTIPLSKSRPRK